MMQYVDFLGVRVPIFLWRGYEASWEDLRAWCLEIGVDVSNHFVPDETQPNWLTLYTGEKYSNGRGSSYRMLVGMYVVRLPGSWPFLMCYTRNEVLKIFRKSLIP